MTVNHLEVYAVKCSPLGTAEQEDGKILGPEDSLVLSHYTNQISCVCKMNFYLVYRFFCGSLLQMTIPISKNTMFLCAGKEISAPILFIGVLPKGAYLTKCNRWAITLENAGETGRLF